MPLALAFGGVHPVAAYMGKLFSLTHIAELLLS